MVDRSIHLCVCCLVVPHRAQQIRIARSLVPSRVKNVATNVGRTHTTLHRDSSVVPPRASRVRYSYIQFARASVSLGTLKTGTFRERRCTERPYTRAIDPGGARTLELFRETPDGFHFFLIINYILPPLDALDGRARWMDGRARWTRSMDGWMDGWMDARCIRTHSVPD